MQETRTLMDLVSVGPATIEDFGVLGIESVKQLHGQEANALYQRLCEVTGATHDPCCIDVFSTAIAQAEDPNLPKEQCNWWYWSRIRKGEHVGKEQ